MVSEQHARDRAHLWRVPALGGVELLHADHVAHAFSRHWHRTWMIELVTGGADAFECGDARHLAHAGDLIVIRPYEAHTGSPTGAGRLRYRSVYPDDALMARCAGRAAPHFPRRIVRDPVIARRFAGIHAALESDADDAAAITALEDWFGSLAAQHASGVAAPAHDHGPALEAARRHADMHAPRRLTLAEWSRVAGLTPFHFARRFRRAYGAAPHEYLLSLRIERARDLLRTGAGIADAALAAGFADQSHLTRHFKRAVGVTPGRYRAAQVRSRHGCPAPA